MHPPTPPEGSLSDFIEQARRLFTGMDRDYQTASQASGFTCTGCDDNCCRTLFHHHTYLEHTFLHSGFEALPQDRQRKIVKRAAAYVRSVAAGNSGPAGVQAMCPLNEAGRCVLYPVRPMICRLHGIPHRFTPPGQPQRVGPGCKAFYEQSPRQKRHRLDRTPHYLKLARLEARLRQRLGLTRKIKLTVAEMLLRKPPEDILSGTSPAAPQLVDRDHSHETD